MPSSHRIFKDLKKGLKVITITEKRGLKKPNLGSQTKDDSHEVFLSLALKQDAASKSKSCGSDSAETHTAPISASVESPAQSRFESVVLNTPVNELGFKPF